MKAFEWEQPRDWGEAISMLDPRDLTVRVMAGGTALMLMMKSGVFQPTRLISLQGLGQEAGAIVQDAQGGIRIGALCSLTALGQSSAVATTAPVIIRTLKTLSNVRVRNVATLGGHLAHADPHMDLPPVMMALGATVKTVGARSSRTLTMSEFYRGYYETALEPDELICEIVIPSQVGRSAVYLKCSTRAADDWPTLGVAVNVKCDGDVIEKVRIVVSAATEKPIELVAAQSLLEGHSISPSRLNNCAELALAQTPLVSDARGTASYKKELLRVYLKRAIQIALKGTIS